MHRLTVLLSQGGKCVLKLLLDIVAGSGMLFMQVLNLPFELTFSFQAGLRQVSN